MEQNHGAVLDPGTVCARWKFEHQFTVVYDICSQTESSVCLHIFQGQFSQTACSNYDK